YAEASPPGAPGVHSVYHDVGESFVVARCKNGGEEVWIVRIDCRGCAQRESPLQSTWRVSNREDASGTQRTRQRDGGQSNRPQSLDRDAFAFRETGALQSGQADMGEVGEARLTRLERLRDGRENFGPFTGKTTLMR